MATWSVLFFSCPNKLVLQGAGGVYGRGVAVSGWEMWDAGLGKGLVLGREKGEDTELSKDRQKRVC